jgi:hypothetical protein
MSMSDDPQGNGGEPRSPRLLAEKFLTQENVQGISWATFSFFLLGMFLSAGYEVIAWLKNGEWPRLSFSVVFDWMNLDPFPFVNGIEWQGIKKLLLWYLELPLGFGLLGLGVLLGGGFYVFFSRE